MKLKEAIKTSKFNSPQMQVILEVLYTAGCIDRDNNGKLKPFGISIQQYNILRILKGAHPKKVAVHEIKERMVQKTPNTTRLIDKLITKSYVTRERCENDRRVIYIEITNSGIDFINKMNESANIGKSFLNKLNNTESEQIIELLEKLRS
jgi:MarR family transcriptional regulator, 2-MHQ and catechol-resistance regulon repressor